MVICLHDKSVIETYLRRNSALHIYELGDLEDFFWPYTQWFSSEDGGEITALFLMYYGKELPVVLALADGDKQGAHLGQLLAGSRRVLPRRFYASLSLGLASSLAPDYELASRGPHLKMVLTDPSRLSCVNTGQTVQLTPADEGEILALYSQAHPDSFFDPRMVETGYYYGVWENGRLASVAGIHNCSPRYGVAALGNIATLPECRGRGFATQATGRLCQELLGEVQTVGLDVRADNAPAVACYTTLGFIAVAEYEEGMVTSA